MNPYGISAITYYQAGFSPLPAIGKLLKVSNASGRHPMVAKSQIEKWTRTHGPFNVALRLPTNVIALDIDHYKGDIDKLTVLEEKYGVLPSTWNSDSRNGIGGKVLYRVPADIKWASNVNGITIVQHTHRYVMAYPSYNKESTSMYQWYDGLSGQLIGEHKIPSVDDLAELPIEWVELLTKHETIQVWNDKMGIGTNDLDIFNGDTPCKYMEILIELCSEKLKASYDGGLHDTGLSVIGILVTAACDGHSGVQEAVDIMTDIFYKGPRNRDLGNEWNNLVEFVLAHVDTESINEIDTCGMNLQFNAQSSTSHIRNEIIMLLSAGMTSGQIRRRLFPRKR